MNIYQRVDKNDEAPNLIFDDQIDRMLYELPKIFTEIEECSL